MVFNDQETNVQAIFDGVQDTVSPDDIFSSVEYTDELLYGAYAINDLEKDVKKYENHLASEMPNLTMAHSTSQHCRLRFTPVQNICPMRNFNIEK